MPTPTTTPARPIERKVSVATAATYLASLVTLAILTDVDDPNGRLVDALPYPLGSVLVALAPTAITFLSAWVARHTPRPDAPQP